MPLDPPDNVAALRVLADLTAMRANLISRGVTLSSLLGPDEHISNLTHFRHKYKQIGRPISFVIDASVVLAAMLPDEQSERAAQTAFRTRSSPAT